MPPSNSLKESQIIASTPAGLAYLDKAGTADPYAMPRHIALLNRKLVAVARGDIKRLMVFLPPRHGKSMIISQYFPAWYLGVFPERRFMLTSYGDDFSAGWGRKSRDVLQEHGHLYGVKISDSSSSAKEWNIHGHTGGLIAAGVGGQLTGHGSHVLSIDDPFKSREEAESITVRERVWDWYTQTAYPRLEPDGAVILVMQRWHGDDLAGRLLAAQSHADHWDVVNLPAIAEEQDEIGRMPGDPLWPERFSLTDLERIRAAMGGYAWSSQYQQRPSPAKGATFRREWMERRYRELPLLSTVIQTVDSAFKTGVSNDYSVIATWGTDGKNYYLLDVWCERVEFPDLISAIKAQATHHRPNVIVIEDAASGQSAVQTLKRDTNLPIVGQKFQGSKQSRADSISPLFESGKVYLPESAPWLSDWIEEHIQFPKAPHDDRVDTTSMALLRLREPDVQYMPNVLEAASPAAQMGMSEAQYQDLASRLPPGILL